MDFDNTMYVAHYDSFYVGSEESKYRLSLSGYNNITSSLPDGFLAGGHSNAEFTTEDEDNDSLLEENCASRYSGGSSSNFYILYHNLLTVGMSFVYLIILVHIKYYNPRLVAQWMWNRESEWHQFEYPT